MSFVSTAALHRSLQPCYRHPHLLFLQSSSMQWLRELHPKGSHELGLSYGPGDEAENPSTWPWGWGKVLIVRGSATGVAVLSDPRGTPSPAPECQQTKLNHIAGPNSHPSSHSFCTEPGLGPLLQGSTDLSHSSCPCCGSGGPRGVCTAPAARDQSAVEKKPPPTYALCLSPFPTMFPEACSIL